MEQQERDEKTTEAAGQNRHMHSCRTEPSKTTSQEQSQISQQVSQTQPMPIGFKAAPRSLSHVQLRHSTTQTARVVSQPQ